MNNQPVMCQDSDVQKFVESMLASTDKDMRRAALRALAIAQQAGGIVTAQIVQQAIDQIVAELQ